MTTPRLGIGFLGEPGLRAMAAAGARAEEAGFESAWVAETRITRDAVTGVTALLLETRTLRVGSAAINVFTRGAGLVAVTWATLAQEWPGRVVLGLGGGSAVPLAQQGYPHDHTVSRMREFAEALRGAWTSPSPYSYEGAYLRFEGLDVEVRPTEPPPIYFCVAGPRALACAGQVADGVVFDAFLPPSYVVGARSRLDESAAGRHFGGELAGVVVVSIGADRAEAVAPVRPVLAGYIVNFPELAHAIGVDAELMAAMRERAVHDGVEASASLLSDELISRHAVCGTAAECRERIAEYRAAGLELPILFPVAGSLERSIDDLAGA